MYRSHQNSDEGLLRAAIQRVSTTLLSLTLATTAMADTIFFDNFDGNLRNGAPQHWRLEGELQYVSAATGDLVFHRARDAAGEPVATVHPALSLQDTSLRTQFRLSQGGFASAFIRYQDESGPGGYYATVFQGGTAEIGVSGSSLTNRVLWSAATGGLDPMREDVMLQFDAIGNELSLWIWDPAEPMPTQPLIRWTDDSISAGSVGVGAFSAEFPKILETEAVFRFIHVANASLSGSVPEPTTALLACLATGTLMMCRISRSKPRRADAPRVHER